MGKKNWEKLIPRGKIQTGKSTLQRWLSESIVWCLGSRLGYLTSPWPQGERTSHRGVSHKAMLPQKACPAKEKCRQTPLDGPQGWVELTGFLWTFAVSSACAVLRAWSCFPGWSRKSRWGICAERQGGGASLAGNANRCLIETNVPRRNAPSPRGRKESPQVVFQRMW